MRTIPVLIDSRGLHLAPKSDRIDELMQTLLRLTALGHPADHWAYEVHGVQSYTYTSATTARVGTAVLLPGLRGGALRYRAWDATNTWLEETHHTATVSLDRLNTTLTLPWADITVGRQAITFGKAYFWNPLDVFLPFDPNQFDRDYKAGVDALRIDLPFGSFSGLNIVGALGREITPAGTYVDGGDDWHSSWFGSALMARAFTSVKGWDLAVQGGKIYGGYQAGGGLTGEIGPLEARLEATYFWALDSAPVPAPLHGRLIDDNAQVVVGVGHRFDNSFTVQAEHFYNGAGESDNLPLALLRLETGASLQLGEEITGLLASYEIMPILLGQVTTLYSWSDNSVEVQPTLSLSTSDNSSVLVGANINCGDRPQAAFLLPKLQSEFGSYPDFYFAELKLYF